MDNTLRDEANKLRISADSGYAQAVASGLTSMDVLSWQMFLRHEVIWATAAEQEAEYRALLSEHVVAQTVALTRIADALEQILALPAGHGKTSPADAFGELRE